MRITIAVSLVLVLQSPPHVYSIELPVPVTCFRRCPITDADCIDLCQQQIETESELDGREFPAGDGGVKRASAFVRIGRPSLDKRTSSFIRIGKRADREPPALDQNKRKDSFVHMA